ncbi:hypothetical protein ACFWB2_43515 [Streptomyces virginiae]|uniref:hypothetical protein n=1 Tax=Streptomyces virginiae TaxID=1961 RepID=UPI0036B2F39C
MVRALYARHSRPSAVPAHPAHCVCETNSRSEASLRASGQWIVAPTDLNGQNPRPDLAPPHIVNKSWGSSAYDDWYQQIVDT